MKLKTLIAISASIILVGANLFVISAKQGSVNCKNLLSKAFSFNHYAYATDPGSNNGYGPTGKAYPNGVADCSVLEVEPYSIDVKLTSNSGQKLKSYVDAGGNLSTSGIPYVNGQVKIEGGNSSDNSSNNISDARIKGTLYVNVAAAKPQYIYCDYLNSNLCVEHTDPCNDLKNRYREQAFKTFGL